MPSASVIFVGDEVVKIGGISPAPAGAELPVVEEAAVPEEGMSLQLLPVEDGIGLVVVPVDGTVFEGLTHQLPAAQPVPLVGNDRLMLPVGGLVVGLYHLSPGKAVAAGAPDGGACGELRLIGIILSQCQGVGITDSNPKKR